MIKDEIQAKVFFGNLYQKKISTLNMAKFLFFVVEKAKQKVSLENCKCLRKKKYSSTKSLFLLRRGSPLLLAMGLVSYQ